MTPEQIRALIRAQLEQRATHEATLAAVRAEIPEGGTATEAQESRRSQAREAIVGIDATIDQHEAALREAETAERAEQRAAALRRELVPAGGGERREGGARVLREERTYSADKSSRGQASFFVDAFTARELGDMDAMGRLQRHAQEVRAEGEDGGERQERATSTGSFGSLVVPQYLIELAAPALRSGRPLANACQLLPLPDQGMTVSIPRGTTGAQAASQATENTALQNTDEVWADLQIPVRTIGGQQDVSRQSLERGTPGMDEIIYLDLAGSYHSEVDRQVATGSGSAGQMLGIANTASINSASAYGAPITAANFNSKIAGIIAAITAPGTAITPNMIAMNPRRWGWLTSLSDNTGRPLVLPQVGGPMNVLALNAEPGKASGVSNDDVLNFTTIASLHGLPMITDNNIPTSVGTNLEDLVLAFDRRQALLWEAGDKQPKRLRFEQTLGGSLTVKLVVYGYAAFTAGRYPVAFGKTGGLDATAGNGQIAPTF